MIELKFIYIHIFITVLFLKNCFSPPISTSTVLFFFSSFPYLYVYIFHTPEHLFSSSTLFPSPYSSLSFPPFFILSLIFHTPPHLYFLHIFPHQTQPHTTIPNLTPSLISSQVRRNYWTLPQSCRNSVLRAALR